jgi:hypothetical protein
MQRPKLGRAEVVHDGDGTPAAGVDHASPWETKKNRFMRRSATSQIGKKTETQADGNHLRTAAVSTTSESSREKDDALRLRGVVGG